MMLFTIKQVRNWNVEADDGNIGSCRDFLFSTRDWVIRYLVADNGQWPPDKKFLISTIWLRKARFFDQRLEVEGTKKLIDARLKEFVICRNEQRTLFRYRPSSCGSTPLLWGGLNNPAFLPNHAKNSNEHHADPIEKDLESAGGLVGYTVVDSDGPLGPLEDIVLNDRDWAIQHIVVDSRNCAPGKRLLVGTQWLADIQWEARYIRLDVSRHQIEKCFQYVPRKTNPGA